MAEFIWREVVVEANSDPKVKVPYPIEMKIGTPDNFYELTTDPNAPKYNTDGTPYYEDGSGDNRTKARPRSSTSPTPLVRRR